MRIPGQRPKKNKQKPNDSAAEEKGICPNCAHLWYVHGKNGCMFHERGRVFGSQKGEYCECKSPPPLP